MPQPISYLHLALIALAGAVAGAQNVLAGGGSFITFPALLLAGINPLAANMTSTVALFPGQVASALAGRSLAASAAGAGLGRLLAVSLCGGIVGALLLMNTPVSVFVRLVPWLVLFATIVFAWGSFRREAIRGSPGVSQPVILSVQACISVYGGYFGGGIGLLMLAALTIAGQGVRNANATKNMLAMAMNASAVAIFAMSGSVEWRAAIALALGALAGSHIGTRLLHRLPDRVMRGFVVVIGIALTLWLFAGQSVDR